MNKQALKKYWLSPQAIAQVSGSSQGTQIKIFEDGYWYKQDVAGYEGEAEALATIVLECSNVKNYVAYERCEVNGKAGCRSKHFLEPNETFLSLQRLYDMYEGGDLLGQILPMDEVEERIEFVKDFVKQTTDLDYTEYFAFNCSLAYLILNIDLHFHNMGVIVNQLTGVCREAPIFDNGKAFMSDYSIFPAGDNYEENLKRAFSKPFSSNFEMQAYTAGHLLKIDYDLLGEKLSNYPATRARQVLEMQMKKCRSVFSL